MTTLRCKAGDLALITSSPNAGKVVTCLEPRPPGGGKGELAPDGAPHIVSPTEGPLWCVDRVIDWGPLCDPRYLCLVPDHALLPIRPEPDRRSERAHELAEVSG